MYDKIEVLKEVHTRRFSLILEKLRVFRDVSFTSYTVDGVSYTADEAFYRQANIATETEAYIALLHAARRMIYRYGVVL